MFLKRKAEGDICGFFIFFFKCLAQKQEKITYVLCVTIIISSYVI